MRTNIYQQEGELAYIAGTPWFANPYPKGPRWAAWRVGWCLAWSLDEQRERAVNSLRTNSGK